MTGYDAISMKSTWCDDSPGSEEKTGGENRGKVAGCQKRLPTLKAGKTAGQ
jgi:hypothetical protein